MLAPMLQAPGGHAREPGHARDPKKPRIELRRFAGHSRYVGFFDEPVRVAHLTDQHVGRVTPFAVQMEAVAMANAERPDLVALTGDFVCHSLDYLDQLEEVVRAFTAPVVCVLGNHDYWSGAEEVAATLGSAAASLLRAEAALAGRCAAGLRHETAVERRDIAARHDDFDAAFAMAILLPSL